MTVFSGPDQARAQIDRDVANARQKAIDVRAMRERVEAVRGRAETRSGDVVVEVDSGGAIVALDLTPAAMDRRPADLSAAIVQTMRQAQARVAQQVSTLPAETFGADSATTERVRGDLDRRFVAPEPEDGVDWGSDRGGWSR